jgi:hypothetical protein
MKMQNKKTTIAGILVLAASVLTVVATVINGGDIGSAIQTVFLPALAGSGLLMAGDGSL